PLDDGRNTMADKERIDASSQTSGRVTEKKAKSTRPKKSTRKSAASAVSKLRTKGGKTGKRKSALNSASKKSKRSASRVTSKKSKRRKVSRAPQVPIEDQVAGVLGSLQSVADPRVLNDMSVRYGIFTDKAFGVSMSNIQLVARPLGSNHELALALWNTGW